MSVLPLPTPSPSDGRDAIPDAEAVRRVLTGDRDGFAVLVERYQAVLFRHALGMVRDADVAADLVQDAFVRAYGSLRRCESPDRFGGWVFRILANRCRDYLKSAARRGERMREDTAFAPRGSDPEQVLERRHARAALEDALAALPPAQREALLLKHVEGCSYDEMAERLDASVSALKMRVMRAREALQARLADFDPAPR